MDYTPAIIVAVLVGLLVVVIILVGMASAAAEKKRREDIYRKYGHTELAEAIIAKKVWQGQTTEQLEDSLGNPADTDEKVLKTKTKVIWKYHHKGGNRYGLRITVENGEVVGWDEKL